MRIFIITLGLFFLVTAQARAEWFCTEAASERDATSIFSCGIGIDALEDRARKKALENAFQELEMICNYSVDCKQYELIIDPMRSDCQKEDGKYKCYRGIRAHITKQKRKESYARKSTIEREMRDFEIRVNVSKEGDVTVQPQCSVDTQAFEKSLLDLSTPEKIDEMDDVGSKVPLSDACWPLHREALSLLSSSKIEAPSYKKHLLNELSKIDDPAASPFAYPIVRYVHRLGPYSQPEWEILVSIIRKVNFRQFYSFAPFLFHGSKMTRDLSSQKERIDRFLQEAVKGKIGKPVALGFDDVFIYVIQGMPKDKPNYLKYYAFEKFFNELRHEKPRLLQKSLFQLYESPFSRSEKRQLALWMADNINRSEPSKKLGGLIMESVENFKKLIQKLDEEDDDDKKIIEGLEEDLAFYKKRAREKIEKSLVLVRDRYDRRRRAGFCYENGFECKELIPSVKQFKKMLRSKKSEKRREALELLVRVPPMAGAVESSLVNILLNDEEFSSWSGMGLHRKVIDALLVAETSHHDAIRRILEISLDRRYNYDKVFDVLGAKVNSPLLAICYDQKHPKQLAAIRIFGHLGKKARAAIPELEKLKRIDSRRHIADAIDISLRQIQQ